ncbi:hypothetical protein OKA06_09525 [Novosphingobium sp. MW5]|nr:hypothetical protein [Novosphingobium sp. MW5]
MRLILPLLVTALISPTVMAAPAAGPAPRAVKVGGDADYDACGSVHKVVGLKKNGDNFLSVRASPSVKGRELDRLRMGRMVWSCDSTEEGDWIGVVYERRPGQDCGVGTPIAKRRAYSGPCASGWVSGRFLEIVAG